MKKIGKQQRRALYKKISRGREKLAEKSPFWGGKVIDPFLDYVDMIFIDHAIFRIIYTNRHQLTENVWRASQPWPHQVRYYAKKGIRTIVNLRGDRDCGSYRLEKKACKKYGIELIDFPLKSRAAPNPQMLSKFRETFDKVEYPILMHCKSGADRAGLAAVLYLHLQERIPLEGAMKQLSVRFGHFKRADTGILDYFFERYMSEGKIRQVPFLEWVDTLYNPEELKRSFEARSWANTITNAILLRE